MPTSIIYIDVVSDVVCPWCFLGRKQLQKALSLLPNIDIRVHWKPFQLTPQMPMEGKPYHQHIKSILGSQNAVDEAERKLIALGKEADIEFDFAAISKAPNTLDAHRVIYWASQDEVGVQDKLVGLLFSAYFEQGKDIDDHEILVEIAKEAGMRADVVKKLLTTDIDRKTIIEDCIAASKIGVQGVPCFILDKKFVVMGAQKPEILADALQQIADGFEIGSAEDR